MPYAALIGRGAWIELLLRALLVRLWRCRVFAEPYGIIFCQYTRLWVSQVVNPSRTASRVPPKRGVQSKTQSFLFACVHRRLVVVLADQSDTEDNVERR